MERKIAIVSLLSIIAILALLSVIFSSYGYTTFALILFPYLLYIMGKRYPNFNWVILVTGLFLITTSSVNIMANLTGHLLFYYEFAACCFIFLMSFQFTADPKKSEAPE
ncbi:hypothetical protein [Carboxylicivirga sp. N1Y90]|uniref:hypothetical protein n=1 Tax=Carboxylicivirga fragile TaxID=3417571 RepID=UPI003D352864|nr:hypothetical protein [Marinilabiliaceae bacterium N1Y90]